MVHKGSLVLFDTLVKIQRESNLPLNAGDFTERLANDYDFHFSRQYVKKALNELTSTGRLVMVGKTGKTELFSLPNQPLDPWRSTVTTKSDFIRLNESNYTFDSLVNRFSNMSWSPFNEPTNNDLSARLTLLLLGHSVDDLLMRFQISPVKDVRTPVEELANNLENLTKILRTILNNVHVKNGSSGDNVSDETRAAALNDLDTWITNLSINKRSVQSGD